MTQTSTSKPTNSQRAALERAATVGPGWSEGVNGNVFHGLVRRGYVVVQDGKYVISEDGRAALNR